MTDTIKMN